MPALLSEDTRRRINHFDSTVDRAFDHVRGRRAPDRLFYGASELGDHGLIWLMFGALRGLRSEHDWHAAVRLGVGMGIESVLVNGLIKSVFRRARPPWEVHRPIRLRRPRTSSFPSGHATSAFTAAGLLSDNDNLWPLYYGTATVVAWSRVHVKIHHASDVVAGIAIGILLGRIGRRMFPLPPVDSPAITESQDT